MKPDKTKVTLQDEIIKALEFVIEREFDLDPESRNYRDEILKKWKNLIRKARLKK